MGFCITGNEELDALLGACPLCGRPVSAAELALQEGSPEITSWIEAECRYCRVIFHIEAITWLREHNYSSLVPAIDVWNKLSSQGQTLPAALNKIRARHDKAKGVERSILAEVLEILEA